MNELTKVESARAWDTGFTVETFLRLCDAGAFDSHDDGKIELVDGLIDFMPPPFLAHSRYGFLVANLLAGACQGRDVWLGVEVGIPTGPKSYRTADIAIVRSSVLGMQRLDDPATNVLLVVEVAQRSQTRDLVDKVAEYATAGIAHYWVVDVDALVTHAFRLLDGTYVADGEPVPFGRELAVPGTDLTIVIPNELD